MEPEGAAMEGEEGTELRVVTYKLTVRVLRFVAKLDDGSERQVAEHDVEFHVNMKHFTVEKMIELIGSKIVWGSGQEVHILCKDKHFESVERIDNYWKLLTSFLERWEEKELLVLAQVVDIAKGTTSSCYENIPSSEILTISFTQVVTFTSQMIVPHHVPTTLHIVMCFEVMRDMCNLMVKLSLIGPLLR